MCRQTSYRCCRVAMLSPRAKKPVHGTDGNVYMRNCVERTFISQTPYRNPPQNSLSFRRRVLYNIQKRRVRVLKKMRSRVSKTNRHISRWFGTISSCVNVQTGSTTRCSQALSRGVPRLFPKNQKVGCPRCLQPTYGRDGGYPRPPYSPPEPKSITSDSNFFPPSIPSSNICASQLIARPRRSLQSQLTHASRNVPARNSN
ncbi:unnamed protein product [Ectocarpus fasciculatus]